MLKELNVSEEHIPRGSKKIDGLTAKKKLKSGSDGGDSSSISEFDLN